MSLRLKERRIDSFDSRWRRNSKDASTSRSGVALPPYFASSAGLTPTSWVDLVPFRGFGRSDNDILSRPADSALRLLGFHLNSW